MNLWIAILVIGLICVTIGFIFFFKNFADLKNNKQVFLVGIFLPLFLAFSYGENLISHSIIQFTIIDLGGLLVLGIISGIFISCSF